MTASAGELQRRRKVVRCARVIRVDNIFERRDAAVWTRASSAHVYVYVDR